MLPENNETKSKYHIQLGAKETNKYELVYSDMNQYMYLSRNPSQVLQ